MRIDARDSLTIFAGRAGDRNQRAMAGAVELGTAIAKRWGVTAHTIGARAPVVDGDWRTQLQAALPDLQLLAEDLADRLSAGRAVATTMGRCAASLATLPVVARHYPNAAIVWFDAHGDCNSPADVARSESPYLGGMVLSGAAGEWSTGLGAELDLSNVVLVGSRDLDPPEWERIESGRLHLVETGDRLAERLLVAVGNRPVYIHLDCDVLEPGLLSTEYQVPGGLSFEDLAGAFEALCRFRLIGIEITEFEASWPDGSPGNPSRLLDAISSLLSRVP